jgi:hypothetical protein
LGGLKNEGCLREGAELEQYPSLAGKDFDAAARLDQLEELGFQRQRLPLLSPPPARLIPNRGGDEIEDPLQAPHCRPPLLGPDHDVGEGALGQNSAGRVVGRDAV